MQPIQNWSLLLLCSLAGFVMVTGSFLLLWYRFSNFIGEGQSGSEVNLFDKIKFKTNYPILVIFFFGALLLAFPVQRSVTACDAPEHHRLPLFRKVNLRAKLGDKVKGARFKVVAISDELYAGSGEEVKLGVPYDEGKKYTIMYLGASSGRTISFDDVMIEPGAQDYTLPGVDPDQAALALAEEAARAQKVAMQTSVERQDVVDEFKSQGGVR